MNEVDLVEQQQEKGSSLPWTGERYVPELGGTIRLEHIHRYILAREMAAGKDVLDIASGEGYGTAMVAEVARSAVGVDISAEAVVHAKKTYKKRNIEFRMGSCVEIPYPDQSFDLIVSFETIEHHSQHEEMMVEFKRVLRPDGQIIISSPEKYEYSVAPNFTNSFHVKELYHHEFEKLLKHYFGHVTIFGQRVLYGSAIFCENKGAAITTYDSQDSFLHPDKGLKRPLYLIAIASDKDFAVEVGSVLEQDINQSEPIVLMRSTIRERDGQINGLSQTVTEQDGRIKEITQAVAVRDGMIISLKQAATERDGQIISLKQAATERDGQIISLKQAATERDGQIISLNQAVADRDGQFVCLNQAVADREGQIISLNQAVADRDGLIANTNQSFSELDRQIKGIFNSISWRITKPLRRLRKVKGALFWTVFDVIIDFLRKPSLLTIKQFREYIFIRNNLENNSDVDRYGIDPVWHYVKDGAREGRNPSNNFNTSYYLTNYTDVVTSKLNPLYHFIKYGKGEGRFPSEEDFLTRSLDTKFRKTQ
jgi:SAM-dependent methyltransferase